MNTTLTTLHQRLEQAIADHDTAVEAGDKLWMALKSAHERMSECRRALMDIRLEISRAEKESKS